VESVPYFIGVIVFICGWIFTCRPNLFIRILYGINLIYVTMWKTEAYTAKIDQPLIEELKHCCARRKTRRCRRTSINPAQISLHPRLTDQQTHNLNHQRKNIIRKPSSWNCADLLGRLCSFRARAKNSAIEICRSRFTMSKPFARNTTFPRFAAVVVDGKFGDTRLAFEKRRPRKKSGDDQFHLVPSRINDATVAAMLVEREKFPGRRPLEKSFQNKSEIIPTIWASLWNSFCLNARRSGRCPQPIYCLKPGREWHGGEQRLLLIQRI